jgi:hypothetical protein
MHSESHMTTSCPTDAQPPNESLCNEKNRALDYPRVLLVNGQAIGQKSGVGATLANLFRGWPLDRLAQIVPPGSEPDSPICKNNWTLGCLDGTEASKHRGGAVAALHRKYRRARGYRLSPELQRWIAAFDPHVVYSYLEQPLITHLVAGITKRFAVPVIPHLMDEWRRAPTEARLSVLWWHIRQQIDFRKIMRQAPFGLSISEAMSEDYQERYRRPFFSFANSADPNIYVPRQQQRDGTLAKLRMVYAGSGPGLGRWPIILNLAQAVRELNRSGCNVELAAFVRRDLYRECLPPGGGFAVFDYADEMTLAGWLGESDIAVLPEGFDRRSMTYSRLSFSSKLPIYLMSGCCILAIGPLQNNSVKYVRDNNLGVLIHDAAVQVLLARLRELYEHREQLGDFCSRNRQFALEHHSQPAVHERLRILLNTAR